MKVTARIYDEGTYKTGVMVHWKLERIYVDKTIDIPEGELLEIVKEAFISDSILFHSGHVVKVCMDYVAEPYYTEI